MTDTEYFREKLLEAAGQVRRNIPFFGDAFPRPCTEGGVYPKDINTDWTPGLFTGQVWLSYEATGDPYFREAGLREAEDFHHRLIVKENLDHHDLGFLFVPSCVAAYRLTGDQQARDSALAAADLLMRRFQEKGGFIQAWGRMDDPHEYRLIIDCLLNVPLLWWASEVTGDLKYARVAERHTETAAAVLFRDDGSTCHTCFMDPDTGEALRAETAQGYSADSAWARGQAWGVLGMALASRFTGNDKYLDLFRKTAAFFIRRLPEDHIPYWDLIFTDGREPRDSSAAAIAVCGIYEALPGLSEEERTYWQEQADRILFALADKCAAPEREGGGLLLHSVYCNSSPYNSVKDYGVDESCLWGDYFYMEALMRRTAKWRPYW
ncbi:MAG: glycoside hydrolase family 88 protein [Lachnospiraceae bacterium]|jgi:unsaturated chondroitin disaccharide hydrolase